MSIADYGFAIWETFYVTVLSTAFALVLGLPLGVLLVAGDKDGVLPLPGCLMHILNIVINILRSVPFLILMICVFPLTRVIVGTTVGTKATIVPLVVAAFPFVARLVETSLRELDEGVVEAAQSMGATPFQIITKVMIPECLPGLISSMTTAQNGGQGRGHAGNEARQTLRDHDLGDDLERGRAHALCGFHHTFVQFTEARFHEARHKWESGDHQRYNGGLGAHRRAHDGAGKRENADHQNQERNAAQDVDDDIQQVHQPAGQGQDAVLIPGHQQHAQRQADDQ